MSLVLKLNIMIKKSIVIVLAFTCFTGITQISGYGIQLKSNLSNQFTKVLIGSSGTSIERDLFSFGGDLYLDYKLSDKFTLTSKFGYEQKGFSEKLHIGFGEPIGNYNVTNKYKFNYSSIDLSLKYYLNDHNIKPYITAGVSTGYLLSKHLKTDLTSIDSFTESLFIGDFNTKYDSYSKINFGFLAGFGLKYKNLFWAELEFNRDILSPIKTDVLLVKNRVYSLNLGINILKLVKK